MPPTRKPYRKTKPRRRAPARRRGGAMASNTKTVERVVYRATTTFTATNAARAPGFNAYNRYSAQNLDVYNLTASSEFLAQSKLFDEFKVSHVKITYKPFYNVITPTTQVANADINLYTWVDRDGGSPVSSAVDVPQKIQAYDSCRISKITKGFSRTMKLKTWWTNCDRPLISAFDATSQPWINAGAVQQLSFFAQNVPITSAQNLGQITCEWHVQFRGKITPMYGYDPVSGSVILTPLSSYATAEADNPPPGITMAAGDETVECGEEGLVITSAYDGSVAVANTSQQ